MAKQTQILNINYEINDKEIVFTVEGTPRFKMPTGTFLGLIDVIQMREATRHQKETDRFGEIQHLDVKDYVAVQRLMKKGLEKEQITQLLGHFAPAHQSAVVKGFNLGLEHQRKF